MLKSLATILLGAIGSSMLTGCVVYHHPHHDDVVVEPAGYRVHDRVIEHHDYDHHDDRHWDRDDRY